MKKTVQVLVVVASMFLVTGSAFAASPNPSKLVTNNQKLAAMKLKVSQNKKSLSVLKQKIASAAHKSETDKTLEQATTEHKARKALVANRRASHRQEFLAGLKKQKQEASSEFTRKLQQVKKAGQKSPQSNTSKSKHHTN